MLIEFAATNFRSLKDRQSFSLLPVASLKKRNTMPMRAENYPDLYTLPNAVLYGANNSGKSNFIIAIKALNWLVTKSNKFNSDEKIEANEFFKLDVQTIEQPTIFEIDFIAKNKKRYNYSISFTQDEILTEKLYGYSISPTGKTTRQTLFERNKQEVKFIDLKGKKNFNFLPNQLILSKGDNEGNEELIEVYTFFAKNLQIVQATENHYTNFLTNSYARFLSQNKNTPEHIIIDKILNQFDANVIGTETAQIDQSKIKFGDEISQELKDKIFENIKNEIYTTHKLLNNGEEVGNTKLPLNKQSTGFRKLLGVLPVILASLKNGDTLFIDELNTSLHTDVTSFVLSLFNNPQTNPNKAQIISSTHDITLLDRHLFDRDQIFIAQKNRLGISEIYSFADFNFGNMRSKTLSDYYETGKVGGLPNISDVYLNQLVTNFLQDGKEQSTEAK